MKKIIIMLIVMLLLTGCGLEPMPEGFSERETKEQLIEHIDTFIYLANNPEDTIDWGADSARSIRGIRDEAELLERYYKKYPNNELIIEAMSEFQVFGKTYSLGGPTDNEESLEHFYNAFELYNADIDKKQISK